MAKLNIKEERVPKRSEGPVIGVYVVEIPESPFFYIGSSCNLFNRAREHRKELRQGKHPSAKLQGLYDHEQEMSVTVLQKAASRDEAYDIEQELLDLNKDNPFCLNIARDARCASKGRPNPELAERNRARDGYTLTEKRLENIRLSQKPVVADGVRYPGVHAAARELGVTPTAIRHRIKSQTQNFQSWNYAEDEVDNSDL